MTATAMQGGRGFHIALWVVQVLLALVFIGAGLSKMATSLPALAKSLPYTADLPGALVRFIGAAEVAGALGLLLPSLFRILPSLTPLAALGLTTIMVLATLFHISRGEWSAIGLTLALGALAGFVAWGRMRKAPITAR